MRGFMSNCTTNANLTDRFRSLFTTRDFIFHDGRDLRRFSVAGQTQALLASIAAVTVCFSAYGVAQAAVGAIAATGVVEQETPEAKLARANSELARMRVDVAAAKQAAAEHASRVEARQRFIAAVLSGKREAATLDFSKVSLTGKETSGLAGEVLSPLLKVEQRQIAFAIKARKTLEERYALTATHMRRLGLRPERYVSKAAMGGPFEPVTAAAASDATLSADAQFRSLFQAWKKLDVLEQTAISIPSSKPVDKVSLTSNFGVRSDPFRGTRAMHAGVDIPGPIGTPIYATADGIVSRAGRIGGYGNMVEINHGKGIETRYGHMSKLLVADNARVHRGQLIGLMGSTGRSTGSHLHYEVRIDGRAVNPIPFMQNADYLLQVQDKAAPLQVAAVGGPEE